MTAIGEIERKEAPCPKCGGDRWCDQHGELTTKWEWSDGTNSIDGQHAYYLLQCRGCEMVFHYQESSNSEDVDHEQNPYDNSWETIYHITKTVYPKPESATKPNWVAAISKIDERLGDILHEVYTAKDQECYMLTAIGIRTAIDRATEILGIEPAKTFAEKLEDLKLGGWIGETEYDILEVITEAGHAAAHRGWTPDIAIVGLLLSAFELFLQRAILVGNNAMLIRPNLPPKPKRIPQAPARA